MDRKIYLSMLAALFTITAFGLLALLAAPIAKPLAWALIIGISTLPYHSRLTRAFPGHPDRTAVLMVFAVTVCFILPVATTIGMVANNASEWYSEAERLMQSFASTGTVTLERFPFAGKIVTLSERFGMELSGFGSKLVAGASGYLLDLTTHAAKNLGELIFTMVAALFILFFIYRDAERIVSATIVRFASDQNKARRYVTEICATTTAVTVGTILTCLVQGITAGVGYFVAGVPAPVLCAALTALVAFVPVVGTAIVWVPLALLVAANGAYLKAVLLAIWCLFFVGLADNAIRPLAIGAKNNISISAVVLGAICGVYAMGVLGLILGPVVFAFIMAVWREETAVKPSGLYDEK